MRHRQPVVRKCEKITRSKLHDLLMIGWQRCIARYGREAFQDELGISRTALEKQLAGAMPGFDLIVDACCFDGDVLAEIADELGFRIVPKDAVCDVDDLNVVLARALVSINEATHPDSPGGRTITHSEYLASEELMRTVKHAAENWLEACRAIRQPREVA